MSSVTAKKLYEITFTTSGEVSQTEKDKCSEIIELFSGEKADTDGMTTDYGSAYYEDEKYGGEYYPSGTFAVWSTDELQKLNSENASVVKKLNAGTDDLSEEYFTPGKEKVSVPDALEYAENLLNTEYKSYFNNDEELTAKKLLIMDNGEGGEYLVIRFSHAYKGLEINDAGFPSQESEFLKPCFLDVVMTDENKIAKIDNRYYYKPIETEELDNEIITPDEAVNLLTEYLAPQKVYTVSEVKLKYVCKTDSGEQTKTYTPAWCFTLNEYDWDGVDYFPTITACVDAYSGEIFIYDSLNETMY